MTPSGDFAGGEMAEVIRNTSLLSKEDREAMAAYIASLPPRQGPPPPPKKKNISRRDRMRERASSP